MQIRLLHRFWAIVLLALIFFSLPANSLAATSVESLVKQAEIAGKTLNSAIFYTGSAAPVKPEIQLKSAVDKYVAAKSAVSKLPSTQQSAYYKRLEPVALSINRGKIFIAAIKKGEAISSRKKNLEVQPLAMKYIEPAYKLLASELKDITIFDKVYGSTTRTNLKNYYVTPAQATQKKFKPANDTKYSIDQFNKLISAGNFSSSLAAYYKKIIITMQSVTQPALKKELSSLQLTAESRVPSTAKTGNLGQLLKLEGNFRQIDSYVKPQKSHSLVPGLYKNINITLSTSLFSVSEQEVLKKRLSTIMGRLKIDVKSLKELLTQKAIAKGIPPEIVKGIVLTENSSLQQFTSNGDVFTSSDNGFGIMQVTPVSSQDTSFDWNVVKYDLKGNIDAGLSVLLTKWKIAGTKIPIINNQKLNVLEDWYFTLWAYNGLSNYNDPNNPNAHNPVYQWKVYDNISRYVGVNPYVIQNAELKVVNQDGWPSFASKMKYVTPVQTISAQMYVKDNIITLKKDNVRFRISPSTSSKYAELPIGTKVQIVKREEDASSANFFNWYLVKTPDGKQGWIASVNFY